MCYYLELERSLREVFTIIEIIHTTLSIIIIKAFSGLKVPDCLTLSHLRISFDTRLNGYLTQYW